MMKRTKIIRDKFCQAYNVCLSMAKQASKKLKIFREEQLEKKTRKKIKEL